MEYSVRVVGLEGLSIKLEAIIAGSDGAMKAATYKVAQLIANEARNQAPVKTGDLKQSIRAEPGEGTTAYVRAGGAGRGSSDKAVAAGGVFYAWYQEMGTSRNAAHPYMRPAVEHVTGESGISEVIGAQFKALWGGAAGVAQAAAEDLTGGAGESNADSGDTGSDSGDSGGDSGG